MTKNAKLTIWHIRSIQAKVKYSILLLQHSLKKLLYFQKMGGGGGGGEICGHIWKKPHVMTQ